MPGFLGGSSSSSSSSGASTGGEIQFPSELIDPVTKLRVSQPETLIDTDFEYGLQPTKWETVELINNTPSFFSKSGDTTIPNITSILSTEQSREIKVVTSLAHGLAVGIPINVAGTKSLTANGSFIINSIPTPTTFTYLCKQNQAQTASIEDLYTSVITGEFFQGSQIKISDSEGITTDAGTISTLTVKTDSPHGFGTATPFYFLNLNSSISQEFDSSNTTGKSFDASNSSTAQTFDGSNTLNYLPIDLDNKASTGNITSSIIATDTTADTVTVSHQAGETFVNAVIGTPLYYNVIAASGYFATNPRGVVFIKSTGVLSSSTATFSMSATPDGPVIDLTSSMTGTFQLANLAKTFAGNNLGLEAPVTLVAGIEKTFDGGNSSTGGGTISSFSGSLVSMTSNSGVSDLDWYQGTMVKYTTTGNAATGLTANGTYFIDTFFFNNTPGQYFFTLKNLPGTSGSPITSMSGGTGTQKFTQIGVSTDLDIIHVKNHGFVEKQMIKYTYPANGRFGTPGVETKDYYFVTNKYDDHNFKLNYQLASILPLNINFSGEALTNSITTTVTATGFAGTVSYTVSPALPSGISLNPATGVITGTTSSQYSGTHTVTGRDSGGGEAFQTVVINLSAPPPQGQSQFTSPGSYTFTVPARVATISAVAIGAGAGGSWIWSYGAGGGGGTAWCSGIPVIPGETFAVQVGQGGSDWTYGNTQPGGNSYLTSNRTGITYAIGYGGGQGGPNSNGGSSGGFNYTGGSTGGGGRGGYTNWNWDYAGGGAGGYNGRGGEGTWGGNPGYGGGGAAGNVYSSTWGTPAGGGTGIFGQGNDGVDRCDGCGGGGGSGGGDGTNGEPYYSWSRGHIRGGDYGGGGGGSGSQQYGGGYGGNGAVRIIWGAGRAYPNTNTANVTVVN